MHRVEGVSMREISRRTGLHRKTVARALAAAEPPRYSRPAAGSKLDPFKDWICEQLAGGSEDPVAAVAGARERAGLCGRQVDLRRLRAGGPAAVLGAADVSADDLSAGRSWSSAICGSPSEQVPVGHGQRRRGWVVTCEVCWSRAIAGTLIFSKEAPDILLGPRAEPRAAGGAAGEAGVGPRVGDRRGRPPDRGVRVVLRPAGGRLGDPRGAGSAGEGALERSHRFMRSNFEPGRVFANHLDFQDRLDAWTEKANGRVHRTVRAVPAERLAEEQARMRPLPGADARRRPPRRSCRVPAQPFVRVDRNDYSIDPAFAGRRVEVRVSQTRGHRGRAGHRRARRAAPAGVRRRADDHRSGASDPARAPARAAPPAPPGRGRDPAAVAL